jgi:hypothetical protein
LGLGGIDRELRAHGSLLSGRSWVAPPIREIALGSPKIAGGHSSTEGVRARFDPRREWGAIASPISLVRGVGEGPRASDETMNTAAPTAVMIEREHLVGRKCEHAVTKTPASPRAASSSRSISGVEAEPCLDRLLEQRGHAC